MSFQPGLVGGHCIGVDPYYLVEKAKQLGMETEVISAGRKVNDGMADLVVEETVEAMGSPGKVLVMGLTFKEDVPDTRNSQSTAVIAALQNAGCTVLVHDAEAETGSYDSASLEEGPFDAIIILVKHKEYCDLPASTYANALREDGVLYDAKGIVDQQEITESGRSYLTL